MTIDLEKPHWGNFEACLQFLKNTGLLTGPKRILEIGCGKGGLVQHLMDAGHSVFGVDYDRYVIVEGVKLYGGLPVVLAGANHLPFPDQSFDLVLSFDVFEHIPDSDAHLKEVARILREDGHYLLQTPNRWTNMMFEPIRFAKKYGLKNTFLFLEYPHHCSLHNYWQLKRRFQRNGFDVLYFDIAVVNDFFRWKIERYLGKLGLAALHVLNPDRLPLPLRTNFFLQAKKT